MRRALPALLTCAALVPASASAAPTLDGTFTPTGTPGHITPGPDGNVWFTLKDSQKEFGRIAPDGTITEYDTPNNVAVADIASGPSTAGGAHDRIWMTQEGLVVKWDPAAGTGTAHAINTLSAPRDIAADADGNMWAVGLDRVVKIAPDGTKLGDFLVGQVSGRGITRGSDGRMYLADFGNSALQAFTTANPNAPQKIDLGVAPQEVEPGPSGQLGVSLPNSEMARVSIQGAVQKTTDAATDPFGVAYGNDGAYWFAQFASNTLGRLTSDGQYSKPITLPAGTGPRYIARGAGDTLWVTGETSKKIHRITGVSAPVTDPTPDPDPDPDQNPPPDTTAPTLSGAKVSVRKRRLSVTLSETAALNVQIEVKRNGRRIGGKCKALKRGQRTSKPCRYWKRVRTVIAQGAAGKNSVPLGKAFDPGSHRAVVTALDGALNRGGPVYASFKV
jgi:virginiamycin B lyase